MPQGDRGSTVTDWAFSALLGALVGIVELLSRYKDDPARLLAIFSAYIYAALNALASVASFYAIRALNWDFGATEPGTAEMLQVLVSGIAGMAVLRSSVFNLRIGNSFVPIGPSVMLITLLAVADNGVGRARVQRRAPIAQEIMQGISFSDSANALVSYCVRLMQNLTPEDEADIRKGVEAIAKETVDDSDKAVMLGLFLLDYLGPDALKAAVKLVRSREIA